MFGFIFGTACLAGLFYTLRHGGRWGHHGHRHGRRGWRGRMRWVFERLETSPGQEKVFVEAAEALSEAFAKLRDEMGPTRAAMARTLRGEHFDSSSLKELHARHDALLEEVRHSLQTSLSKLHESLDPQQRRELADMLEHGWGYGWRGGHGGCGWRGGYRSC
jgi:Spy/CpxP family protein refolding chaperone